MISEFFNALSGLFKEAQARSKSSLLSSTIIAATLYNWEPILYYILSPYPIGNADTLIYELKRNFRTINIYLFIIVSVTFYLYVLPQLNYWLNRFLFENFERREKIAEIIREGIIESQRKEVVDIKTDNKDREGLKEEIEAIKEDLKEKDDVIKELSKVANNSMQLEDDEPISKNTSNRLETIEPDALIGYVLKLLNIIEDSLRDKKGIKFRQSKKEAIKALATLEAKDILSKQDAQTMVDILRSLTENSHLQMTSIDFGKIIDELNKARRELKDLDS